MSHPNDLHDRLIDTALREVAGGHAPPDLSARILAAADNPVIPAEETTMERPTRTRRVWFALAIAACLLVAAGFILPAMRAARESAKMTDSVLQGAIENPETTESLLSLYDHTDEVQPEPNSSLHRLYTSPQPQLSEPAANLDEGLSSKPRNLVEAKQIDAVSNGNGQAPSNGDGQAPNENLTNWAASNYDFATDLFGTIPNDTPSTQTGPPAVLLPNPKPTNLGKRPGLVAQNGHRFSNGPEGGGQGQQVPALVLGDDGRVSLLAEMNSPKAGAKDRLREDIKDLQLHEFEAEVKDPEGQGPDEPGDQYTRIYENPFIESRGEQAVSTFSIDVDTASYANVRQFLESNQLPPPDAVRLEELINYFDYRYEPPAAASETPFSAAMEVASCPWEPKHRLVRIALQGRELEKSKRPVSNLVFLIDVSGSMDEPNKLPLVVEGMKQLVRELGENDRVAIVVYASSEGLVLPSTPGTKQATILESLDRLQAGGSTAGGAGIQLAYQMAEDNFVKAGVNRVILCTDGDFNVGVTSTADLERMVEQKANDTKVFLSVLGFGRGNLNDAMMETISNRGNGNYHYVDNLTEARKVLVEEMTGTLVTIAKDVKIQVEFNPAQVAGYRLLGYENRMLRTEDFNDDKKDAGEIGAGHRVTALYEIAPSGEKVDVPPVDDLKYQQPAKPGENDSKELLTLKLRYKQPDGDTSTKIEFPLTDEGNAFSAATPDFKFATAVASFGMLLRDSEHKGNATYDAVLEIATEGAKHDPHGYRAEFLDLVRKAKSL